MKHKIESQNAGNSNTIESVNLLVQFHEMGFHFDAGSPTTYTVALHVLR